MRKDILARFLSRFGPHALFHVTSDLNRVLLEDEISGSEGVHLTSYPQRAIQLATKETGQLAGIVILDRRALEMGGRASLPLERMVGFNEFDLEGVYPVSWYASGLFRLSDEPEPFAEQRFGWQLMVQIDAMQRHYTTQRVPREAIEPFYQLYDAMAAHFLGRYDVETYVKLSYDACLANWLSAQDALEQLNELANPTASSALTMH